MLFRADFDKFQWFAISPHSLRRDVAPHRLIVLLSNRTSHPVENMNRGGNANQAEVAAQLLPLVHDFLAQQGLDKAARALQKHAAQQSIELVSRCLAGCAVTCWRIPFAQRMPEGNDIVVFSQGPATIPGSSV